MSHRRGTKAEPLLGFIEGYQAQLQGAAQAWGPLIKVTVRCQIEAASLVSRRARAALELPSRLAACRSPFDLMSESLRFWSAASDEYAQSSRRIMDAWMRPAQPMAVVPPVAPRPPVKRAEPVKRPPEPAAAPVDRAKVPKAGRAKGPAKPAERAKAPASPVEIPKLKKGNGRANVPRGKSRTPASRRLPA